jgi:hypothetical protein
MRALIAKTKAFREDGVSAWALTGATLSVRLNEIRPEILAKGICRARISAGPFAAGSNSAGSGALRPFKILVARPGAGPAPIDEFRDQPTASSPRPSGAGCSASSQRPLPTPVGACNPRWRAMGETQAAQPLECPYTLEQVLGDWLTRRRPPSPVSAPATVSCAGRLRLARFRRLSGRIGEHGS